MCFLSGWFCIDPHLVAEKTDGEKRKMKVDFFVISKNLNLWYKAFLGLEANACASKPNIFWVLS